MAYTNENNFPIDLVPEPYQELCCASYHLGRSTARSLREAWTDADHYGEGFTAGLFFRVSEIYYDMEQKKRRSRIG